jgi:hypothetical protein
MLELVGSGFWFYQSYDLRNDIGKAIRIGECEGEACYMIVLAGIDIKNLVVDFRVGGPKLGVRRNIPPAIFLMSIPLKTGCRRTFYGEGQALRILIENNSVGALRAGVAFREDLSFGGHQARTLEASECP